MKVNVHKCRNISHPFPLFAWGIMIIEGMNPFRKNSWSHMAMSINHSFFDVTGKGCNESASIKFLEHYRIVETHSLDIDISSVEFYTFFDKYKGRPYDDLQIIGLLLKGLNILTFNKYGHDLKQLVCNELPLAFIKDHFSFSYGDSDDYGIVDTWNLVKRY